MSEALFAQAKVRWLVGISVLSFVGGLALMVFGPDFEPRSSRGTDSFSESAIGHRAFRQLLARLDIPVIASRSVSRRGGGAHSVLVLAEPHGCPPYSARAKALGEMLEASHQALLVLPKWEAKDSPTRAGWVETLTLIAASEVEDVLMATDLELDLRRVAPAALGPWQSEVSGYAPSFSQPRVQLLTGSSLAPLVSCSDGVLLGEIETDGGRLLVLSDPDVLCNAGIGQGRNAALVVAALEMLRPSGGSVVIDETIHGHVREPSIWRELFSFPLVILMAQAGVVLLILLWAAMGRFGAPARGALVLEPGRRFLVENTAELLRFRGDSSTVLPDYLRSTVQGVRRALSAPAGLHGARLEGWLDRIGQARGATDRIADLRGQVRSTPAGAGRTTRLLASANRIHRWRQEILHGPSSCSGNPQSPA